MDRAGRLSSPPPASSAEEYKALLREVGVLLGFHIEIRPKDWSPSKSTSTIDDNILRGLQYLFFKGRRQLEELVAAWSEIGPTIHNVDTRISRFLEDLERTTSQVLEKGIKQPNFTPGSHSGAANDSATFRDDLSGSTSITRTHAVTRSMNDQTHSSSNGSMQSNVSGSSSIGSQTLDTANTSFASIAAKPELPEYGSSWGPGTQEDVGNISPKARQSQVGVTLIGNSRKTKVTLTRKTISPPPSRQKSASDFELIRDQSISSVQTTSPRLETERTNALSQSPSARRKSRPPTDITSDDQDAKRRCIEEETSGLASHQIRNFPLSGFGLEEPEMDANVSWPLKWDILRAANTFNMERRDIAKIKSVEKLETTVSSLKLQQPRKFELSKSSAFSEHHSTTSTPTLSGYMRPNEKREGAPFMLQLGRIETQISCRAQRRYGWQRFLYVDIDLRKGLPPHLKSQEAQLDASFKEWLLQPCLLLGRTWRAFHLQKNKKKNNSSCLPWRIIFFATYGFSLVPIPLHKFLLEWTMAARYNGNQSACKAYSRVDLALSRTTPTIKFTMDQIRLIDDLKPTSITDHDPFLDKAYQTAYRAPRQHDPHEAMTDGCARISVGASKLICEALGIQHQAAAFQARIFGAKGVWYASSDYNTRDPEHLTLWIEIRKSQLKLKHCRKTTQLDVEYLCDETLTSFDVNKYSHSARSGELHRDFLHILEDRGVARGDIMALAAETLDRETATMIEAIHNPVEFALLLQKHIRTDAGLTNVDSNEMPRSAAERLTYFLHRGGFMPNSLKFLAGEYQHLCTKIKLQGLQGLRVPCPASTVLLGIAHHSDLVPAGKVHINFSEGIGDGSGSHKLVNLAGKTVLIARDPTLRASDIQKYECVFEPRLAHLPDVVIFSSQGSMPGAAKHQGGDYDGDMFWVCWHAPFTSKFKNARVLEPRSWKEFGISKDTTLLQDFAPKDGSITEEYCDKFLAYAFQFKYQQSFLGIVTNQHYALTYGTCEISTAAALDLADLHDHLNDEAKNGYTYSQSTYLSCMKKWRLYEKAKDPAYKVFTLRLTQAVRDSPNLGRKVLDLCGPSKTGEYRHILDDLYFNIFLERTRKTLEMLSAALRGTPTRDLELEWSHTTFEQNYVENIDAWQRLKQGTRAEIQRVVNDWSRTWSSKPSLSVEQWHNQYLAIEPSLPFLWTKQQAAPLAYSNWDCIRASMLFGRHHGRGKPVLLLAKGPLCHIKANSVGGRKVRDAIAPHIKVRRPKLKADGNDLVGNDLVDLSDGMPSNEEFDNVDSQFDFGDLLTDCDFEKMSER